MNNDFIKRLIEDARRQQEAWNKLLRPFAESIQRMNEQMEPYRRLAEQVQKQVEAAVRATEPLRQHIASIQASLDPMRDMMRRFIEQQQALKENYRKAQDYLFAEGWYLGSDMPVPNYKILAKMVDAGEHAGIEQAMCEWARSQTDDIIEAAAKAFPDRAQILRDAAEAHRNGKYC